MPSTRITPKRNVGKHKQYNLQGFSKQNSYEKSCKYIQQHIQKLIYAEYVQLVFIGTFSFTAMPDYPFWQTDKHQNLRSFLALSGISAWWAINAQVEFANRVTTTIAMAAMKPLFLIFAVTFIMLVLLFYILRVIFRYNHLFRHYSTKDHFMREVAVKGQVIAVKGKASKFALLFSHNLANFDKFYLRCKLNMLRQK